MTNVVSKDEKTMIIPAKSAKRGHLPEHVRAVLIALSGEEAGSRYEVTRDYVEVGRADDVDIRIPRQDISRKHCLIFYKKDRFYIRDLESTNGTFLNGHRIDEKPLAHGDKIRLGEGIFQFVIEEKTGGRKVWEI